MVVSKEEDIKLYDLGFLSLTAFAAGAFLLSIGTSDLGYLFFAVPFALLSIHFVCRWKKPYFHRPLYLRFAFYFSLAAMISYIATFVLNPDPLLEKGILLALSLFYSLVMLGIVQRVKGRVSESLTIEGDEGIKNEI